MNPILQTQINQFSSQNISVERRRVLQSLVGFINSKVFNNQPINLNFICTHNSRRSHLSQIWASAMAYHFRVKNVNTFSGGTEATALFFKVAETLEKQGFEVLQLSQEQNPVYGIKFATEAPAVICFSKKFDHPFNPSNNFAAIMTCNSADEACPVLLGAEARFSIKFNDPKAFDGTDQMDVKYAERSLEIGQELWWVFGCVAGVLN